MSLANVTSTLTEVRPHWLLDRIGKPIDKNMHATLQITAASEGTSHPWYNDNDGSIRIPGGTLMAIVTSGGLAVPCTRTSFSAGGQTADTTITVNNAAVFKVGGEIGNAGANQTISSIVYSTGVITVDTAFGADLTGDVYDTANAGNETAYGLLTEDVILVGGASNTPKITCAIETRCIVDESRVNDAKTITATAKTSLGARIEFR